MSLDLSGQADPERSLGTATLDLAAGEFATVASDFAAAQAVCPDLAIACTGVTVALACLATAAVYVALHDDDSGQPAATPPLAESRIDPSVLDGTPAWHMAGWAAPVPLEAGRRYWLILRGIQGESWLAVARAPVRPLEALRISRGGAFWRPLQNQAAHEAHGLIRLLYLPGPENPTSPVELVVRSAASGDALLHAPLELAAQPQPIRLEVPAEGATGGVRLEIHSSAAGSATLANLIQEYD